MSDLSYNDRCVITHPTGEEDEWNNPLLQDVYSGECDFQPGGQQSDMIMIFTDKVYIHGVVKARSNDLIDITPQYGIGRKGIIEYVNFLPLDIEGDCETEISIKQSTEKTDEEE